METILVFSSKYILFDLFCEKMINSSNSEYKRNKLHGSLEINNKRFKYIFDPDIMHGYDSRITKILFLHKEGIERQRLERIEFYLRIRPMEVLEEVSI